MADAVVNQLVSNGGDAATTTVTVDISNTEAGAVIHVLVGYFRYSSVSISSITDTQGNTYTAIGAAIVGTDAIDTRHYYAQNIVGGVGANTITVTFSGSCQYRSVFAKEIRNVAISGVLVGSAQQEQLATGTSTDAVTSGNATITDQPNLFSGWAGSQFNADTLTAGTGFTNDGTADRNGLAVRGVSKRTTSTASDDATWTSSLGTQAISSFLAVFKELVAPAASTAGLVATVTRNIAG